jgi:hypothetical protein
VSWRVVDATEQQQQQQQQQQVGQVHERQQQQQVIQFTTLKPVAKVSPSQCVSVACAYLQPMQLQPAYYATVSYSSPHCLQLCLWCEVWCFWMHCMRA